LLHDSPKFGLLICVFLEQTRTGRGTLLHYMATAKMLASVVAFDMFRAGVYREAVNTKAIRRYM
jgi:hypothetical protein